jgi:hypothetical protein
VTDEAEARRSAAQEFLRDYQTIMAAELGLPRNPYKGMEDILLSEDALAFFRTI